MYKKSPSSAYTAEASGQQVLQICQGLGVNFSPPEQIDSECLRTSLTSVAAILSFIQHRSHGLMEPQESLFSILEECNTGSEKPSGFFKTRRMPQH